MRLRAVWSGLCALSFVGSLAAAEGPYAGSQRCEECHGAAAAEFSRTAHARAPGWDAQRACESCHGPGSAHAESTEPEQIVRPERLPAREADAICLECHRRQENQFSFRASIHHLAGVSCISCHDPHSAADNLLPKRGKELCRTCHEAVAGQLELPRRHPLDDCSDCHDPHATRSLRAETSLFREVCTDCHIEKEGPFTYEHDVIMVDGCASCHEVHGSPNRHLLKHEPQVNLCYQCHSASVTPGWHSAPRFLNEKCTACHTAIHGSNTNPFFLEE